MKKETFTRSDLDDMQRMVDEMMRQAFNTSFGSGPQFFYGEAPEPDPRGLSKSEVRVVCEEASRRGVVCRLQRMRTSPAAIVTFVKDGRVLAEGMGETDKAALADACEELRQAFYHNEA